jgi:methyl-accepting chemotaxis protein
LNETAARLQEMTRHIHETSRSLTEAAAEILTATAQQAAGATEQATAVNQTSTTIDEIRSIAEQVAQRAQGVTELAQQTMAVSQDGQQAIDASIAGMEQVKVKVEKIAQNILVLSEQTQAIGQIISAVSDIASQSNMLALNAAVEAARAGEAGRGFAVVASEVRALAEQSRAATLQVKEILTDIQQGVNTAVMVTEEGMKGAEVGMHLVAGTRDTIRKLADSVTASAEASQQIAASADQQVNGMELLSHAMESILQVSTQAMAGTRQSERAAVQLNALAGQLCQAVEQYQL